VSRQPVGPNDQVRALYDYSDPDKLSFLEVRAAPVWACACARAC